jgi:hypothetical protein
MKKNGLVTLLFVLLVCVLLPQQSHAQFGEVVIGDLVVEFFEEKAKDLVKDYGKDLLKDLLNDIHEARQTDAAAGICADEYGLYLMVGDDTHYDLAYIPLNPDGSMPTDTAGRQLIDNAIGSSGEALAYDSVNGWLLITKGGGLDEVRVYDAAKIRKGDDSETHLYTGVGYNLKGLDCHNGISYIASNDDKIWIGRFYKNSKGNYKKDKYVKYEMVGTVYDVALGDDGTLWESLQMADQYDMMNEYSTGTDGISLSCLMQWEVYPGYCHRGVATDGQLVYMVNANTNGLDIFDYNCNLKAIALFPTNCISPNYVEVVGNYVYVTDSTSQGDTNHVLHCIELDPGVVRDLAADGLQSNRIARTKLTGTALDAEEKLMANLAVAIESNQLNFSIQLKQSQDLVTWTNFGSSIDVTRDIPPNSNSLFYCITAGRLEDQAE